jgi:hypothetical protein
MVFAVVKKPDCRPQLKDTCVRLGSPLAVGGKDRLNLDLNKQTTAASAIPTAAILTLQNRQFNRLS